MAKAMSSLFGYLATDFAALIGRGMDVEIPLVGHQVGGLGVGQRRLSFERAFCGRIRENWDLHAGVIAGFGRSVEMGCGCRANRTVRLMDLSCPSAPLRMRDVRSRRDVHRSLQVSFCQAGPPQLAASLDTVSPVAPKVSTSIQNAARQWT